MLSLSLHYLRVDETTTVKYRIEVCAISLYNLIVHVGGAYNITVQPHYVRGWGTLPKSGHTYLHFFGSAAHKTKGELSVIEMQVVVNVVHL